MPEPQFAAARAAGIPDDPTLRADLIDRALLHGSFTLRSGAIADRYFDKFRATTDPHLLGRIAAALAKRLDTACGQGLMSLPDRLAAPELGAVPLVTALSLHLQIPFVIVRSAEKSYGTGNRIEGPFEAGDAAVLVEDVVTSGGAALSALTAARDAGLQIAATLCVLDREAGGTHALAAAGAPVHALITAEDIT